MVIGSQEGKLCWFDMDLSTKPYKTLRWVLYVCSKVYIWLSLTLNDLNLKCGWYTFTFRNHHEDIRAVAFHMTYPLFASCADDSTAHVFHGMVYTDLLQNPLIVPLKILHGHQKVDGNGNGGLEDPSFSAYLSVQSVVRLIKVCVYRYSGLPFPYKTALALHCRSRFNNQVILQLNIQVGVGQFFPMTWERRPLQKAEYRYCCRVHSCFSPLKLLLKWGLHCLHHRI